MGAQDNTITFSWSRQKQRATLQRPNTGFIWGGEEQLNHCVCSFGLWQLSSTILRKNTPVFTYRDKRLSFINGF